MEHFLVNRKVKRVVSCIIVDTVWLQSRVVCIAKVMYKVYNGVAGNRGVTVHW